LYSPTIEALEKFDNQHDFERMSVDVLNAEGYQMRPRAFVKFRGIVLDPAIDGRVIDMQSPFLHQLFQVAIAERIPQLPAHAEQNDLGFKMTPFAWAWIAHEGNSSIVLEIKQSLPEHPRFCNTTPALPRPAPGKMLAATATLPPTAADLVTSSRWLQPPWSCHHAIFLQASDDSRLAVVPTHERAAIGETSAKRTCENGRTGLGVRKNV
jgi:hypothetical protein